MKSIHGLGDSFLTSPWSQVQAEGAGVSEASSSHGCIHELFEKQARRTPDAVAVQLNQARLSYDELNRSANRLAHHLRSLGVGPETLVGIRVDRSLEMRERPP